MDRTNWTPWVLLAMWGVYLLCFVPFLPTSITYIALLLIGLLGTVAALTCIIRRNFYPRTFLSLGLLYFVVFLTSIFTARYLYGSSEAGAGAVPKFLKGSMLLIRARIDSGDLWPAFTIAYTQLVMPVLVLVLAVAAAVHITKHSRRIGVP